MDDDAHAGPRARARSRLDRALANLAAGSGSVVFLTGEFGIGRTELVRAAVRSARSLAVAWDGSPPAGDEPVGPWSRAAASLADGHDILDTLLDHDTIASTASDRWRWRSELVAQLRRRSGEGPILFVLEDLDRAHPASMDLLRWLAPQLSSMPVGVVATIVSTPAGRTQRADLDRLGEVVALSGLTPAELGPVLDDAAGTPVAAEVAAVVHRRTSGNPRFAAELVRDLADADALMDHQAAGRLVPGTVHDRVDEHLAGLTDPARAIVDAAAALGTSGPAWLLGAVGDRATDETGGEAGPAAPVVPDLLRQVGDAWWFTHEVVRDAVLVRVHPSRRARIGGAAATILLETADEARAADDPDRAVELLRRAGDVVPGGQPDRSLRARVLVELGEALQATGDGAGARTAHAAAARAARGADPVLLARAALGLGSGPSGFEVPLLDRSQLDLLEEALAAMPATESAWEARLRARLAVALTYGDEEERRLALADRAVELARTCGDPGVLAACLAARCDVRAGPEHSEERAAAATEIIALARGRDRLVELLGLRLRIVARLEQGDLAAAESDMDAFAHESDRLGDPMVAWYPPLWRAARHLLYGHAAEADRRLQEAIRIGQRAGSTNAAQLTATLHWWAPIEQRAVEDFAAQLDQLDDMPPVPWVRVALALGFAELGRANAAVVQLDAVTESLAAQPQDSEWLPMLAQVAHVVGIVGAHPIAETARALLLPYRHRHVVEGIGAVMLGSVERPLGVLAAALGDRHAAAQHFAAAEAANRRLGGAALVARTLRDAGAALDDPVLLEEAAAVYDEIGWERRLAEVRDRARALGGATGGTRAARVVAPHGTFRREADGWAVGWQGATAHVRDVKGLHDLARLLDRPGRDVPALDLVTADAGPGEQANADVRAAPGDLGPVLDDEARRAYRARLAELERDVQTSRDTNDPVAMERAVRERDALVDALTEAYGLGGRPRRAGEGAERARTTVTSRIRDAIARVSEADPALGRHLDNAIRTGRMCSYRPEMPVEWER